MTIQEIIKEGEEGLSLLLYDYNEYGDVAENSDIISFVKAQQIKLLEAVIQELKTAQEDIHGGGNGRRVISTLIDTLSTSIEEMK